MLKASLPTAHELRIRPGTTERLMVALSFDDGYLEHYKAAQLLYKRHIRATFFLITGLSHWNNKPLLTLYPKLIQRMRKMDHEIASHTQTHPNLQCLSVDQVRHELHTSKDYLQNLLNEQVEGFAYPYGKYDEHISRIVSSYYGYARTAREVEKLTRYELPIRSPGSSLRMCSLQLTKSMIRGKGFAIVLIHSTNDLSLNVWVEYMKMFRVHFVTLSELVAALHAPARDTVARSA